MPYRRLILFVEGATDEEFMRGTLMPELAGRYDHVHIARYSALKREKVNAFLRSARSAGWEYLFFADLNSAPCVTARKEALTTVHSHLEAERVAIVVPEIEAWYVAGIPQEMMPATLPTDTRLVTKEVFQSGVPNHYLSPFEFMIEMLKHWSTEAGVANNESLGYVWRKYCSAS